MRGYRQNCPPIKREQARRMRKNPTLPERRLWQVLRARRMQGFRFLRQVVLYGYIADFWCHAAQLLIEVDGPIHNPQADAARDAALARHGLRTLRLPNDLVTGNLDGAVSRIRAALAGCNPTAQHAPR